MEESTKNATENQTAENQQENQTAESQNDNTPSVEELMAQLAQEKAEKQKLQNKYNQASTEAAESKKALRAKQTAEEREAEEKAEAQRLADEEKEAMRKELNHIKAVAAYKNISDEKTVESLIEAIDEHDHVSINAIFESLKEKAVKEAIKAEKVEWERKNPPTQFGTGEYSSMSKQEIGAIKDRAERRKAIAQNMNLFNQKG